MFGNCECLIDNPVYKSSCEVKDENKVFCLEDRESKSKALLYIKPDEKVLKVKIDKGIILQSSSGQKAVDYMLFNSEGTQIFFAELKDPEREFVNIPEQLGDTIRYFKSNEELRKSLMGRDIAFVVVASANCTVRSDRILRSLGEKVVEFTKKPYRFKDITDHVLTFKNGQTSFKNPLVIPRK